MIRAEIKTPHKCFVFHESTIEEAKAYVKAMMENGVTILAAEYFDKEKRENDIRNGLVGRKF